ncbi:MAG: Zn-dependent hydrolase [Janthinobacterium lividum]
MIHSSAAYLALPRLAQTEPDLELAAALFDQLRAISAASAGVTRDSYGAGEQGAHDLLATQAAALGLEISTDAALNLYLTLPGRERGMPMVLTGSHLDSVPCGGNYDGAAGVVAGLAVLAGWARAGFVPQCDVCVMAIRAEESNWFPVSYAGSKAALGLLPASALQAQRSDNGRSLAAHLLELGGAPDRVAAGEAWLTPQRVACFLELHIEQGPVLLEAGEAVGVVTGICGSRRYRQAHAAGEYAHSGATPRSHRKDAVLAVAQLVLAMQQAWAALEQAGHELTVTVGQFATDAQQSGFSKVAGRVDFCIDIRSRSPATLQAMDQQIAHAVADIGASTGVRFHMGPVTGSREGNMDPGLRAAFHELAQGMDLAVRDMPSGAGHDAAIFADSGIASAMLFVRNANGSHNPDEAMDFADFALATRLLARLMALQACPG